MQREAVGILKSLAKVLLQSAEEGAYYPKKGKAQCIHRRSLRRGAREECGPGRRGFQTDLSHRHGLIIDIFCGVQGVCVLKTVWIAEK